MSLCIHCADNNVAQCTEFKCDKVTSPTYSLDQCRNCWLRIYKPKVRELPCIYEGPINESCKSCGGQKAEGRHVRFCLHPNPSDSDRDFCTREYVSDKTQACSKCPDYTTKLIQLNKYELIKKRHLIYHLLPVNGIWRKGINELLLRWKLFTGHKIISVASGSQVSAQVFGKTTDIKLKLDSVNNVKNYLPSDCEIIQVDNNPKEWEFASWRVLWPKILNYSDSNDAILYAHSKAVTREVTSPSQQWATLLYSLSLDHWPLVEKLLQTYPIVGSLKRIGYRFPYPNEASKWHYSGTFFWINSEVAKTRLNLLNIPHNPWIVEAWPGMEFDVNEGGSIFTPSFDFELYHQKDLEKVLIEYYQWLEINKTTLLC